MKKWAPSVLLWTVTAVLAAAVMGWYIRDDRFRDDLRTMPLDTAALAENYTGLDLNAANAAELEALPGIGPVLAERIIAWREENGPFAGPDDVLSVPGIGQAVYEGLAPYIEIQRGETG